MNLFWLILAVVGIFTAGTGAARAEVVVKHVSYQVDGKPFEGVVAYEAASTAKRPGILIAPEWWGVNDYVETRAHQFARLGYTAFVADLYGGGKSTKQASEAGQWSGALKHDRVTLRKRIDAALTQLKAQPTVDPTRTAAVGYCFGGSAVLELARSNADVLGVVTFHGTLGADPSGPTAPVVKPKILVCHGASDPNQPRSAVEGFEDEMTKAHADWQVILYSDTEHGFTNPANLPSHASNGVAYNPSSDRRSWRAMQDFLQELFETGTTNTARTP